MIALHPNKRRIDFVSNPSTMVHCIVTQIDFIEVLETYPLTSSTFPRLDKHIHENRGFGIFAGVFFVVECPFRGVEWYGISPFNHHLGCLFLPPKKLIQVGECSWNPTSRW